MNTNSEETFRLKSRLDKMIGKDVVIEGTFPLPTPNGQVAYSPAVGKLVAFYETGATLFLEVQEEGDSETTIYNFTMLRSIQVITTKLTQVRRPGITV